MIEPTEKRPPVPADELAAAEAKLAELGQHIPPRKLFLGLAPSPDGDIVDLARTLGEVPAGVLPIAPDPVGNFICLDGRDRRDRPVLSWNQEYEGDPPVSIPSHAGDGP